MTEKNGDIVQTLKIAYLQMPKTFYPRNSVNMMIVEKYANYIKAGAEFPPILVGRLHNHLIVVDGWHRTHAYIKLRIKYIRAIVRDYSSEKDLFADAVRLNQGHGYSLTKHDRQRCIRRLKLMKFNPEEIMRLTSIPASEVTRSWQSQKPVLTATGPGGKHIDIPVKRYSTEEIRLRIIEALGLADNDEIFEVVAVQTHNGKHLSISVVNVVNATDEIRTCIDEALATARGSNLYELAMVLERALSLLSGTSSVVAATEINPRLWVGPCPRCGMPKEQCVCVKAR
jgi:hypothetical protein